MELKKKILLDSEQILKDSKVLNGLNDSEMDHLKGGCFIWIGGDDTTTSSSGSGDSCPLIGGCALACANTSMNGK